MEIANGSIISRDEENNKNEEFLFTYSEEEKQQNEINRENAKLVFSPEFIPYYPEVQKTYDLSHIETILYGFIRFYLANGKGKFYFGNEGLARILRTSPATINNSIRKLSSVNLIEKSKKISASGGTIRFITNVRMLKTSHSECEKLNIQNVKNLTQNNNKINNNKINNIGQSLKEQIKPFLDQYSKSMIEDFLLYWEEGKSNKQRWEMEKTWDVSMRLKKWKKNQDKWDWERSQRLQLKNIDETPRQNENRKSEFARLRFG
jgi:predicted transcriptional regulator